MFEHERQDLMQYDKLCSKNDDSRRPELFPVEYWRCLPDSKRDGVMARFQTFTEERLQVIIPKISTTDKSKEDDQRKAEEPFVRAQFYAFPNALLLKSDRDIQPIKGELFTLEVTDHSAIKSKNKVRGSDINNAEDTESHNFAIPSESRWLSRESSVYTERYVIYLC
jgi:hypothetical protein